MNNFIDPYTLNKTCCRENQWCEKCNPKFEEDLKKVEADVKRVHHERCACEKPTENDSVCLFWREQKDDVLPWWKRIFKCR